MSKNNLATGLGNAIKHEKGSNPIFVAHAILNKICKASAGNQNFTLLYFADDSVLTRATTLKGYYETEKDGYWYLCKAIINGYPLDYFHFLIDLDSEQQGLPGFHNFVKCYYEFCKFVDEGGKVC